MSTGANRGQSFLLQFNYFGILPWEPWLERWKNDLAGVFWLKEEEKDSLDGDEPALGRTSILSWLSTSCEAPRSLLSTAGSRCTFRGGRKVSGATPVFPGSKGDITLRGKVSRGTSTWTVRVLASNLRIPTLARQRSPAVGQRRQDEKFKTMECAYDESPIGYRAGTQPGRKIDWT